MTYFSVFVKNEPSFFSEYISTFPAGVLISDSDRIKL